MFVWDIKPVHLVRWNLLICFSCICNLGFPDISLGDSLRFEHRTSLFHVYVCQCWPQTLAAICRTMGIWDVFMLHPPGKTYVGFWGIAEQGFSTMRHKTSKCSIVPQSTNGVKRYSLNWKEQTVIYTWLGEEWDFAWWRHQMETFSALLTLCAGNSPVPAEFPAQRPVTRSFGVFFDLRLNKWLSKQSWGWWFETPSRPLWRHCNSLKRIKIIPTREIVDVFISYPHLYNMAVIIHVFNSASQTNNIN